MSHLIKNFDAQKEIEHITKWARDYFKENATDATTAVIGISGGKDSTVTAELLARALGRDRVLGVLMPDCRYEDLEKDTAEGIEVVRALGIQARMVNIYDIATFTYACLRKAVDPLQNKSAPFQVTENVIINTPPRARMAVLYAIAASLPDGGRVANTCNRSEDHVGYSTKYGDSAGDFSLLQEYTVHEIKLIGHALGLPANLVDRVPSDGLCGKTDEERFGFSYETLDRYLLTGQCDDAAVKEKIQRMHMANLHKLRKMPACPRMVA